MWINDGKKNYIKLWLLSIDDMIVFGLINQTIILHDNNYTIYGTILKEKIFTIIINK